MSRLPKVAIISNTPSYHVVEVYNEMARLKEIDFRVFYLRKTSYGRHWDYGPPLEHDHIFIRELRLRKHLYLSPGLLREYLRYASDFMVVTQYTPPGMQKLMYFETLRGRPWVFWCEIPHVKYDTDPIIANERLRTALRKAGMLPLRFFAKEIWGIGQRAVRAFEEATSHRVKVYNLPYFSDLERFNEAGAGRRRGGRVRFLWCGSLILRKGADVAAQAVRVLAAEGLDFELHVVGKGPLEANFQALPESARQRVYLHGFQQLNEIPQFYRNSDVLLFPSRHDGWGMTLPEGMGAAMPVISTAQTGSAVDMLIDGQNGFLLPELTLENLTAAMRQLIHQPALIDEMGGAARRMADNYNHRVGARRFLDIIHRAVNAYTAVPVYKQGHGSNG